ncbi:hypothetical protein H206_06120 [Candidatus Electrothrix aarhusensis]|uniref:Uncharacterized protein n=1 Tax=Candidatus Electrothrix aarhusensis TaxID=1859131 RepID=A0A3S3UAX6_9BACT|nr:hypothetical protein H206_06120 [Candidatus Electrothrix aarhusensis]
MVSGFGPRQPFYRQTRGVSLRDTLGCSKRMFKEII